MAEPTDPVSPSEYVFRRIPNIHDRVSSTLPIQVLFVAFRPESADADGISLYRELFVTAPEVARDGSNPRGYYVVRLLVSEILTIGGLSVRPTPELGGRLPGHASIPELTPATNKGATKPRAKEQMVALAKLAGKDIVFRPDDLE